MEGEKKYSTRKKTQYDVITNNNADDKSQLLNIKEE